VPIDPITPDVRQVCSKRAFDGQVKKWRRMLHAYDPPAASAPQNPPPPAKRRADAGAEGGKPRADAGAEGGKRPRLGPQPADAAAPAGKAATAAAGAAADAAPAAPTEDAVDAPAEVQRSIYDAWDEEDVGL